MRRKIWVGMVIAVMLVCSLCLFACEDLSNNGSCKCDPNGMNGNCSCNTDGSGGNGDDTTHTHSYENHYCFGCSGYESGYTFSDGLLFDEITENGVVTAYRLYDRGNAIGKTIIIPEYYKGKPVTGIGEYAFYNYTALTSVVIPNSVISIGRDAFVNCWRLMRVEISKSVERIASGAFRNNSRGLTIYCEAESKPSGWAGDWVLYCPVVWNCKHNDRDENGYAYTVVDGIKYSLKDGVATVMLPLTNVSGAVTIPSAVTYKEDTYSVTSIGERAFEYCSGLTSITIPNNVTSIGEGAFYGCNQLIQKENGVAYVDKWVIYCDTSVTEIILRQGTVGIWDNAFRDCSSLSEITIPSSVTSIGREAFRDCHSLSEITIPQGVTSIGEGAFNGCSGLMSITFSENSKLTSIGSEAFRYCSSLTSITIPNSVTSIGDRAFSACGYLTIYCEAESKPSGWNRGWNENYPVVWDCKNNDRDENGYAYTVVDGIKYSLKDGVATIMYRPTNISGAITIPSAVTYKEDAYNVTTIGDYLFASCRSLTSITIPSSVTTIGGNAFSNCSNLVSIAFAENSKLASIGAWAFSDCRSLSDITIPQGVTRIGGNAFSNCSSLTSITIPSSVTSIEYGAFEGCSSLTRVVFENTQGWTCYDSPIDSTQLSDPTVAATYLVGEYSRCTWTRE